MEALAPERDDEFYIEDEMVVFLVQNRLFKVHRFFFVRESSFFKSMFSLPHGPGAKEGQTDKQPINLPSVTVPEFKALARILYERAHGETSFALDAWIALLSISTRYEMDAIRQRAISNIENTIPPLKSVETIELAVKYDIPNWLTPAYVSICQRPEPIEEWEAIKMGISVAMKLARARELVRAAPRTIGFGFGASGAPQPFTSFGAPTAPFIPPKPEPQFSPQTVLKIVKEVFGTS